MDATRPRAHRGSPNPQKTFLCGQELDSDLAVLGQLKARPRTVPLAGRIGGQIVC